MFILKAQNKNGLIRTYKAETKTDCMFKFDKNNLRKGFRFFMVIPDSNILNVNILPRDYPYSVTKLE